MTQNQIKFFPPIDTLADRLEEAEDAIKVLEKQVGKLYQFWLERPDKKTEE